MQYSIIYSCVSHIGRVRSMNQDNFICDKRFMNVNDDSIIFPLNGTKISKDASIFGIFDGMGGEECGEVASYIAAQNASVFEVGKDAVFDLAQFCQKTNTDICNYAEENGISAMGTTAAMLAFTNDGIALCNIGDSKIFRFHDEILEQISKDHIGISVFGMKPPLSQNLGIPHSELIIDPYLAQGSYNENDIFLICSDGLTDMVTTEEIAEVLTTKTIEEAAIGLLQKALSNGGKDNISIILCKIEQKPNLFTKLKCCVWKRKR